MLSMPATPLLAETSRFHWEHCFRSATMSCAEPCTAGKVRTDSDLTRYRDRACRACDAPGRDRNADDAMP